MHKVEAKINSPYSPCPVDTNEALLRAIFYPDHVTDNNELKDEAIPRQDLSERGFSIQRKNYLVKERFDEFVRKFVDKKEGRTLHKVFPVLCQAVRDIKDQDNDDAQAFIVIDDAYDEADIAHAIIKFAFKQSKSKGKKLRKLLIDEFKKSNLVLD